MRTGKMLYLSDVLDRVNSTGSKFFTPGTMRYWHSRVSDNVYPTDFGTFIVTSERPDWNRPRCYTIRFVTLDGHFCRASEFEQYRSWNGAHKAAARLQKTGFPTCEYAEGKCPHDWS